MYTTMSCLFPRFLIIIMHFLSGTRDFRLLFRRSHNVELRVDIFLRRFYFPYFVVCFDAVKA